jgi:hypothetical protein
MNLALQKTARQAAGQHLHLTPRDTAILFLIFTAAGLVCLLLYRISLALHPSTICRHCGGTGTVGGLVFRWARSTCPVCAGTRLVPRLGTHFTGGRRPW